MSWLNDPATWPKLAKRLRDAGEFGVDTETYGQPDKTSPQHRARIHCWSVGVLYGSPGPRGYRQAAGAVLPRAALDCRELRDLLCDPGVPKWAHNAPHDIHALTNEGLQVSGIEDTLQWLRVACPGHENYGLKAAEQWALGLPDRPTFKQLVTHQVDVVKVKRENHRGCICGKSPCRARTTSDWLDDDGVWRPHLRVGWKTFHPVVKQVEARYEVTDFVEGHPKWQQWIEYSLADAVRGIQLVDWLRSRKQVVAPWPWNAARAT